MEKKRYCSHCLKDIRVKPEWDDTYGDEYEVELGHAGACCKGWTNHYPPCSLAKENYVTK